MQGDEDQYQQQMQEYGEEQEQELSEEDKCRIQMQEIENFCQESQQMWTDPDFQPDDSSLYVNPVQPPDYASPNVEWKRPHEIYTGEGKPMMVKDGLSPGDVKQGELGDCWLLGTSIACPCALERALSPLFQR